jgi:Tfp pilus assembly protein PilF
MPSDASHAAATAAAETSHLPAVTGPAGLDQSDRRTTLFIALGLAVLTFALYLRTLHNGFISYDDYDYISGNPLVQQGLTWHGIVHAFTTIDQGNWFPLEWISLMGTSQFFGIRPFAYHLTNLFLHAVDAVLLFLLLQAATRRIWRAAMVAALFAVFPLNVEAVAWATERKSVLSVFFMLLALAGYGWYSRQPDAARFMLIVLPFALGLMTKAWLVTFPFALLLLDYWPLQRFGPPTGEPKEGFGEEASFLQLVLEKIPLFLMAFATLFAGVYAASHSEALSISTAHAPFSLRLENALWSYLGYVLKGAWPMKLALIYPYPQHMFPVWQIAIATGFLLGVTAVVWCFREKRYFLVGWLWYLGVLFPLVGLVQTGTQSMADRWAYISFMGLFVAVVWGIADLDAPRVALTLAAGGILAAYACVSFVQTGYWRDGIALYTHAINVTNGNGTMRVNLGVEYERIGRPDLAIEQYAQAVVDTPGLGVAHFNFARLLNDQDHPLEAIAEYKLAISNTGVPREIANAETGLGAIYANMNLPDQAVQEFTAAIAANPGDVYPLLNRGLIEIHRGDLESARQDFTRSVEIMPTPATWYTLGVILEDQKNIPAAVQAYQSALQMKPDLAEARSRLQALQSPTSH